MVRTLARGQTFAGYRIERLLGVGGMGEVYLAQDRDLPRPVALKLLGAAVADDPEVRERFLREADTAARLSHPNIVAVYARGRDEHRLWMAMQYVEGTDVAAVLREGPLRPDHAVRIIGETAKALDHAHRAGVLHRDVKPANILLAWGPHQQVYLADFGIAKALDHTGGLTRTGEMYASFQYAAPEQFEFGPVDHRADVYALGCTLFHMLTGELPYPGASTAQVINGHLNMPVPRPSLRHPAVPTAFDDVVAHALAKDPDRRYGSCGELADAAQRALTGVHGAAPRHPVPNPAPTQPSAEFAASSNAYAPTAFAPRHTGPVEVRSRRPRPALLLAALLALLVAFGIGVGFATGALTFTFGAASGPGEVATDATRAAAEQAACDYAKLMTTYDYDTPSAWETRVHEGATGTWKVQAAQLLPALRLIMAADPEKTRAGDAHCTATSGNGTHYEITANVTEIHRVEGKPETTETRSIAMAMDYVDGRWLCSMWSTDVLPN
ncbi:serine/threonine-protein kinase [Nocardia otitidiscaviarum]|uniref:serine/threonine-protein kinase n=1 Tax=Nocardia otitidiscaviarum TaxID=1823 RepID=UPI002B4ADA5D|nr:serine/threonine-protein kinase [Nocardia otitidiscaviarum]